MDRPSGELAVVIEPHRPDGDRVEELERQVLNSPSMREYLANTRHRLLSLRLSSASQDKEADRGELDRFVAEVYDYSNGRLLTASGHIEDPDRLAVDVSVRQPIPSQEEVEAAIERVREDPEYGPAISRGELTPFAPMPPLFAREHDDGSIQRLIAVGLTTDEPVRHRLLAVDLSNDEVIRHLPGAVQSFTGMCGTSGSSCSPTGTAGSAWVTVTLGETVLWHFLAVRPKASSGVNGSGVELKYVDYRGSRVLYQAHVPILNILYDPGSGCGPSYRDWQNGEWCFQATGTDPVPGFRLCTAPATTILDSGVDGGNFNGVAVYVEGSEVVLVSQMSAGWYRYITQWRLDVEGTIRPRWGFSAVDNGCTCHTHTHHVYWRLDFDIDTPGNNRVEEYNNPPIFPGSHWHTKHYEIRRTRDPARRRHWRITNATTGDGYLVIPGSNDGAEDAYGVGDLWVLRWHLTEIDDGQGFTTNPALSMEHIDNFLTGEPVDRQDVVLWYAAHFRHDAAHESGEWAGPELRPL